SQRRCQRDKQHSQGKIQAEMGHGYLCTSIGPHLSKQSRQRHQQGEQNECANQFRSCVNQGQPTPGKRSFLEGGKQGSQCCANICTQHQGQCRDGWQCARSSQGRDQANRGCAGTQDHCKNRSDQ